MSRVVLEPFRVLGSTPSIEKVSGSALALSPVAPLIADVGRLDDRPVLRITNYQTGMVIGQIPVPFDPHTLSFSPDGKHLFFMPGGTSWNILLVYSEPWSSPRIIQEDRSLHSAFHGAWLDEWTILVAGTVEYNELCVAVLDVKKGTLRIVHQGERLLTSTSSDDHLDSAYCSPSGLAAFAIGYGQRIALYQLNEGRDAVLAKFSFPAHYDGYSLKVAISEDGQTILCMSGNYNNPWTGLFDRQGHLLTSLDLFALEEGVAYRHGTICLRGSFRGRVSYRESYGVHIYQVKLRVFLPWCSRPSSGGSQGGVDLATQDGKVLLAIEEEDQTIVFELTDPDILQLASENSLQRRAAVQRLGERRLQEALPILVRLLGDEALSVQEAVVEALAEIGDPNALPHLIRALGHPSSNPLRSHLISALRRFPLSQLVPAIFDCFERPGVAFRRGAVRTLEAVPSIEALDTLCEAIHDVDAETRLSAAHALRKRANMRACIALLGHLNDEDERVRIAVQHALTRILRVGGLLSSEISGHLSIPMDVAAYAKEVISTSRMHKFEKVGTPLVGKFLTCLASACVQSSQPLPQLLNAIEVLAASGPSPEQTSASIGLTVAVICADTMRGKKRWSEVVGLYRNAISLAQRVEAPQIEWRAWHAAGACFEELGDDPAALAAFRNAMGVIDHLWFALLEEDKLRDFFQDKALLYDQAGLCALRLGHRALALECVEKAKTRYLGDLIARRQMGPRVALNRELREFWENIGCLRSIRVSVGSSQTIGKDKDRVEIVATQWGTSEAGAGTAKPIHLAAFEEVSQNRAEFQTRLGAVREIWQLVAHLSTLDDESIHQYVEEIYQALLPIHQAVRTAELPVPSSAQQLSISQFDDAAEALNRAGRNSEAAPFWIFTEYRQRWHEWIEEIGNSTETDEMLLFLDAVMEAFNVVLHHEPVFGVPAEPNEEEAEGPLFVTRSFSEKSTSPSRGTTTIETPLELHSQARWRYITRIARGEVVAYRDIADTLHGQSGVAQLQFSVTADGTAVFIIQGFEAPVQHRKMPDLRGEDSLHVFTCREVRLATLYKKLMSENGWFSGYRLRHQTGGARHGWMPWTRPFNGCIYSSWRLSTLI